MGTRDPNKHPPIPEERRRRYQDLFENSTSVTGIDPKVVAHLERLQTAGGQGIEVIGNLNKDYLGAFHAPFSRNLEAADLAIVGCPLEKAAPMNASHKYGPSELRRLSKNGMGTTEPWRGGFDVPFDECRIIDYGNIDTYGRFDLSEEVEKLIEAYEDIVVRNGVAPFTWGGDHTVSYAPIHSLGQRHGPLGLIHFDAHYDMVTYADFPYPYHSGSQFTRNMAEGNLDPERMITMGVRGRMSALVGGHPANFGNTVLSADDVFDLGVDAVVERILSVVGGGPVYLSLDCDSLDAPYNHSNSAIEPFGLTSRQVWDIVRMVRASGDVDLVGADVVEYAPYLDPSNADGYTLAGISWKLVCWLADEVARRNGERRPTEWPEGWGKATL
jgi:arginase family enzyme